MSRNGLEERRTGLLYLGSESRLHLLDPGGGEPYSATIPDTGSVLRWFVDRFADSDQSIAVVEGATVFEIMDEKTASVPPGCEGLTCVIGDWSPDPSIEGGGAWLGLGHRHGRYHLYRAILEGCAFEVRRLLEQAASAGIHVEALKVDGPGAKSRLWLQIHADICGIEMEGLQMARPDRARERLYSEAYRRYRTARDRSGPPLYSS